MNAETSPLDQIVFQLTECFTPETARRVSELRATPQLQERIDLLAERDAEGLITPE
jgi:hypothetical protein